MSYVTAYSVSGWAWHICELSSSGRWCALITVHRIAVFLSIACRRDVWWGLRRIRTRSVSHARPITAGGRSAKQAIINVRHWRTGVAALVNFSEVSERLCDRGSQECLTATHWPLWATRSVTLRSFGFDEKLPRGYWTYFRDHESPVILK